MALFSKDSDELKSLLKEEIKNMLDACDVIQAVVTVTNDGHMLVKHEKTAASMKRVATMGSSLMSLGDTITSELDMGSCRNLIAENERGILAFMHITDEIVLVTVTDNTAALGMLLSASRNCCERVRKRINP